MGAKDGGGGGADNWSYKTCRAPVKLSPTTNQHPHLIDRCTYHKDNSNRSSRQNETVAANVTSDNSGSVAGSTDHEWTAEQGQWRHHGPNDGTVNQPRYLLGTETFTVRKRLADHPTTDHCSHAAEQRLQSTCRIPN